MGQEIRSEARRWDLIREVGSRARDEILYEQIGLPDWSYAVRL